MHSFGTNGFSSLVCAILTFLQIIYSIYAFPRTLSNNEQHLRHRRQIFVAQLPRRPIYQNVTLLSHGNVVEYGPWGPWTVSSQCSRSCGGGISFQERICLDVRADGRYSCVGHPRRYYLCNTEDCPVGSKDFRSEQCARFNSVAHKGKYYSWLPYHNRLSPCELYCKPQGAGFYDKLDSKVIDGTKCRDDGSLDACVDGQCVRVGCDNVLESTTQEDECGVCGGNGSSCRIIKGVFSENNMEVGYNDILLIPLGATSIFIREVEPTNNFLAIRNSAGVFYLNGNWKIEFPRDIRIAGTIFHYERKPQGHLAPEIIRAKGPTNEPIFVVLLYQEKNYGVSYEYSVPASTKPSLPDEYSWTFGDYEECSQTCGAGVQHRWVRCIRKSDKDIMDENLCDPLQKPATNSSCNNEPCPLTWQIGEWSECSRPCGGGTQFRLVFCHQTKDGNAVIMPDEMCDGEKPLFMRTCNDDVECPDWFAGEWSECGSSCGPANKTRTIECRSKEGEVIDDSQCDESKRPPDFEGCNLGPCEGVEWIVSDWSGCDGSCSPQMESREVHCANEDGLVFPNDACTHRKMPELSRLCPKSAMCEPMWHTSEWTECSVKCGHGVQSRVVFCGAWQDDSVIKIEDKKCDPAKKFEKIQNCSSASCKGIWFTGPWNRCSVPCGGGERSRKILCFHEDEVVDTSQCDPTEEPFDKETCNMMPCDGDEIMVLSGCKDSKYGCCPDGTIEAGPSDEGCPKVNITSTNMTCEEAEYGCCADNFTLALGPFRKGCPVSMNCSATTYGCCPNDQIPAKGPNFEGCVVEDSNCTESVFGCCSDNITIATGPDLEGCFEVESNCSNSTFGCCPDGVTPASGPELDGCIVLDSNCSNSTFGCCPDGVTPASGPELDGCIVLDSNCSNSTFGCCPDGMTAASESELDGCIMLDSNCSNSTYGCCADGFSVASGPEFEGCEDKISEEFSGDLGSGEDCYSTRFGCCPDGLTPANGTDQEGCESKGNETDCKTSAFNCCDDGITFAKGPLKDGCVEDGSGDDDIDISCEDAVFGCCPDKISLAKGFDGEGCPNCSDSMFGCCPDNVTFARGFEDEECYDVPCSNSTFGCCSDNVTSAMGPDEEGCVSEECYNSTFGCCPDNVTSATGPDGKGCITEECNNSTYGCCPDNETLALGPNYEGCDFMSCENSTFGCCQDNISFASGTDFEGCENLTDCSYSTYGCCPDNVTFALSFTLEGCNETAVNETEETAVTEITEIYATTEKIAECVDTKFGCCPDEETVALGPNLEGCCFGMRFGCCPDNKTAALGPTFLGCGCQTFPYGCCPDQITPAQGFNYQGCKCEHFQYGCCQDKITPARGPHYEGCLCQLMYYGCCPDGVTPMINSDGDGCGCDSTVYGCCPDGKTAAVSADLTGCPCETLPHGCCPDGHTPARTSDLRDCPCETQRYGCCLDGRTFARGSNYEGCPCESTRFGCCLDGKTTAQGPDLQSCPCETTRFGCCADGYTSASGPNYEGCPDVLQPKPKISTEVCSLPKETGPCTDFSIKWFFDVSYGGCTRFWYGGCDGNGNSFDTQEECEKVCVKPEGPEVCQLPKVSGSCDGKVPSWYYDAGSKTCEPFTYGGCLGNNNRFMSKQACELKCISKQPDRPVIRCNLPKDEGKCDNIVIQWHYNKQTSRCEQFYYGGCEGNANRFASRRECEKSCLPSVIQETDVCRLPKEVGPCDDYREKWYFDYESGQCHRFMYGGCDGNENNFGSFYECDKRCRKETLPEVPEEREFKIEYCFEIQDPAPCSAAEDNWYYDSSDGVCKLYYGECKNNKFRFKTRRECEDSCFQAQDICSLDAVQGSCSGSFTQWFYDKNKDECFEFIFSGCSGNANRYNTKESCYARCKKEELTTVATITADDVCTLPQEPGPCLGYYRMWFYDASENICKSFVYGGCEGNGNRFKKRTDCEKQCAKKKISKEPNVLPVNVTSNEDVCRLPVDPGPCSEALPRWFYDAQSQSCLPFVFGNCGGNKNRFKTSEICLRFCAGIKAKTMSEETSTTLSPQISTTCAPSNCDNIQCPYGIEETFDNNGCSTCRCSNPCEVHTCPDGSRCAIDVVRTSREGVRTEPVCRRIQKPGVCPPTHSFSSAPRDCETRCRDDAHCRGEHKCCNNGCAFSCMPPSDEPVLPATQPEPARILPGINVTEGQIGQPAELPCNAMGWPKPSVTWWRETTMLPLSSRRYEQLPNFALLIRSVVYEDGGDYSCHAHNGIGSGAIYKVTLIIDLQTEPLTTIGNDELDFNARDSEPVVPYEVPKVPFVPLAASVNLITAKPTVGLPLQIDCHVQGPAEATVAWLHNGKEVVNNDRRRILSNHTLLIHKTEITDSGEYRCSAFHESNAVSSSISFTVNALTEENKCVDSPHFSNCESIIRNGYCHNAIYRSFCCSSCEKAEQQGIVKISGA